MATITEEFAKREPQPTTGQVLIFDDKLAGFGVRLTAGSRSWIVQLRENRKSRRVTLGKVGDMKLIDARKAAQKLQLDGIKNSSGDGRPKTVADLWTRVKADDEHRLRDGTKTLYNGYWVHHLEPAIGTKKLAKVTHSDISTLLAGIPGAANANRIHELARRLFNYALAHKWLPDNPAIGWKRRHEERRENYLDGAQLTALFDALPVNEVGDALRFAAMTGARIGEILVMQRGDIRDNGATWVKPASTTKQKKSHTVPLSAGARTVLERQEQRGALVFARPDGTAIRTARKTWLWALKRSGLTPGARIHDLRHSFASLLINDGASLALVGAALGHATPQTTSRYAHIANRALKEAVDKATNVISIRKAG